MTIEIVNNYRNLLANIGQIIDVSGYRNDYIAKKMGLSSANFSAKKNRGTFSVDEMGQLIKVIENEDVDDFIMLQLMRNRVEDEEVSFDEAKSMLGWK